MAEAAARSPVVADTSSRLPHPVVLAAEVARHNSAQASSEEAVAQTTPVDCAR